MNRGQEQSTKRNSAPRGCRDRDARTRESDDGISGPVTAGGREHEIEFIQMNSGELEGNWRLS
jgi:hypothetical protein